MNNTTIFHIALFSVLVILQSTLFNHINFLGYLNPYIYILFLVYYPFDRENSVSFLFVAFLLGFCIDLFADSGGVHAAATLTAAFFRPLITRWSFGSSFDSQTIKIGKSTIGQRINFLALLTLTHHIVLFSLEIFSFAHLATILKKTILSAIFTLILCLIAIALFSKKRS